MLENLYTTKMSADKKNLQSRFSKIRSKSGRLSRLMAAVMSAAIAVTMLGATVVMAALDGNQNDEIKYEIYNGDSLISLANEPFIYADSYYLPLRETLNAFGITDISYDGGKIKISMPDAERERWPYANVCEISIRDTSIAYQDGSVQTGNMTDPPVLKNNVTYVTETFFYDLIRVGQIPGFRFNVTRELSPEAYYKIGEEVFIGTVEQQENYQPNHLVKRIIVDENDNTIAVIPIENQQSEKLDTVERTDKITSDNYTGLFDGGLVNITADGVYVQRRAGIIIDQGGTKTAYIPTIWQINMPELDLADLNAN